MRKELKGHKELRVHRVHVAQQELKDPKVELAQQGQQVLQALKDHKVEYTAQEKSGAAGKTSTAAYNMAQNKKVG